MTKKFSRDRFIHKVSRCYTRRWVRQIFTHSCKMIFLWFGTNCKVIVTFVSTCIAPSRPYTLGKMASRPLGSNNFLFGRNIIFKGRIVLRPETNIIMEDKASRMKFLRPLNLMEHKTLKKLEFHSEVYVEVQLRAGVVLWTLKLSISFNKNCGDFRFSRQRIFLFSSVFILFFRSTYL